MTIPACRLIDKLDFDGMVDVRHAEYPHTISERVDHLHAISLAIRGEIEGVFSSNGRIKFLRLLPEDKRHAAPEWEGHAAAGFQIEQRGTAKAGSIGAQTNIGAYRQNLNVGWVWALRMANV